MLNQKTSILLKHGTCDTEGWHDAAWDAALRRARPDPPKRTVTDFSLLTTAAAAIALKDDCFTNPPSCSAKTNVLTLEKSEYHQNNKNISCIKQAIKLLMSHDHTEYDGTKKENGNMTDWL